MTTSTSAFIKWGKDKIIFRIGKNMLQKSMDIVLFDIKNRRIDNLGVNFDTICKGFGLFGYIIYLKREYIEKNRWKMR